MKSLSPSGSLCPPGSTCPLLQSTSQFSELPSQFRGCLLAEPGPTQSCISFQSSSFARKPVPVCRTQAVCRTRAVCRTQPCFKSLPVSGASVHDHRARVPASCFQQTLPSLKKLPLLTEPVCVQSLCGLNPHKTSPYLQSLSLGAVSAGPASFPRAWVSLSCS